MNKEIAPVLEKISEILQQADMAGLVIVSNKTHCDFKMEIEPSWSCAWLEWDDRGRLLFRIRSKEKDYPSKEAQKEHLQLTVGTILGMMDCLKSLEESLTVILETVSKKVDIVGMNRRED